MEDQKFDRIKYWVELGKWFFISVAMVLTSSIVSWAFTSRDKSFEEVKFYSDKYLTELIVLNDKVGPRYKLAQFFKNVTVNKAQREGWERYYEEVEEEYNTLLREDSLIKIKRQEILKKDTFEVSKVDSLILEDINSIIEKNEVELKSDLKLPQTKSVKYYVIVGGDKTIEEAKYEQKKFANYDVFIVFKNQMYRTVIEFSSYETALSNITQIQTIRKDAYIVEANKWCDRIENHGEFYECI